MEEQNSNDILYIPVNIKTRTELFNGFGIPEMIATLVVTSIMAVISTILYQTGKASLEGAVLSTLVAMATTVTVTTKDKYNICVLEQIGFMLAYAKNQRKFKYCYKGVVRDVS